MQDATQSPTPSKKLTNEDLLTKPLLTMRDMCLLLSCGRNAIYSNVAKGVIPVKPVQIGQRIYWNGEQIRQWFTALAAEVL